MDQFMVKPGTKVHLSKWEANDTGDIKDGKQQVQAQMEQLSHKLESLQERLFAEHKHKVLVILQAMDAGGKDGTIKHVFNGINPSGVRAVGFKPPSIEELEHDFLWRVHKQVPGKGEMVIFNRSHYEDVLVVRVHNLVSKETWSKRYDQINDFERMLAETGTTILKFYLHIDAEEQKKRLQARLDDPTKRWKFRLGDLEDRKLWDEYMQAYEDVLNKTSTEYAPWYIVPANHKWFRDLVISSVLVDTLESLDMKYPQPPEKLEGIVIK